eukprot:923280-Rhodomonas_salina.2
MASVQVSFSLSAACDYGSAMPGGGIDWEGMVLPGPDETGRQRLGTAQPSRPRTSNVRKLGRKIETGMLWMLEHGNWFST